MIEKKELHKIRAYTSKAESAKAFHVLEGILIGISIDKKINQKEVEALREWRGMFYEQASRPFFNKLIPLIDTCLEDNILTEEERDSILWLCQQAIPSEKNKYYDVVTADIQRIHGALHGILADGEITNEEIKPLKGLLFDMEERLRGFYPFDELLSILVSVTEDGKITKEEEKTLKLFFSEFIDTEAFTSLDHQEIERLRKEMTIPGICALDPEISFPNKKFCFTGTSKKATRSDIEKYIESRGGILKNSIVKDLNYLVVGADGNPCWAYCCYGRKIEQAVEMRKSGVNIIIVNENDFWDC